MAHYYKSSINSKSDPFIKDIQIKLNVIRLQYHGNWDYLVPDGKYGPRTANAVKCFQVYRNITPASGELGPTTSMYINQIYNNQPQITNIPIKIDNQKDDDLVNIVMEYFCKPTCEMVVDFLLSLQKDYPKNTRVLVRDWNLVVDKIRTKLLQIVSKFDTNYNSVYEQIERYWEKKKKLSPNRHNKNKRYYNNIRRLLDQHLGISHVRLDYNRVLSRLRVGKVISGAGKIIGKLDLYCALWDIVNDLNSISESSTWMSKWTKDLNNLVDVLIGIIVGAVVALLLPEEMALILVCLIVGVVGIVISYLLDLFHETFIGQKLGNAIGENTAKFVKSWQSEMNDIKMKNKMAEEAWVKSQGTITIKLF